MMRQITSALVVLALMTVSSSSLLAQDDGRVKLAHELLEKMGVRQLLDSGFDQMMKMQRDMAAQGAAMSGGAEASKSIEPMMKEIGELFRRELSFDVLAPEMSRIYADAFTIEELRAIIGFFDSPAGKIFAAKMPEMQTKAMMISQTRAMALMPKVQEIAKKYMPKQ